MSWFSPHATAAAVFHALADPFLRPLRRVVPMIANVDLSPLVLLLLLQILLMVVGGARNSLLPLIVGL